MASLTQYLRLEEATDAEQAERIRNFAGKIKVDVVTVRRYLLGTRRPSWDVMPRIVCATGGQVTAADFMRAGRKRARSKQQTGNPHEGTAREVA